MSRLYREFSCNKSEICCSTFGRINRQFLVNCDTGNQVHLWDIEKQQYINTLAQCKSSVESVCFDQKETDLSFGSSCGSIVLYNIESRKVFCSFPNVHKEPIYGLDFHPYSTYFASTSDDCVLKVWDIKYKRCITQLNESIQRTNIIKWSPDGSWIILFSRDGSFSKMFDVISGKIIFEFNNIYCGDFHPTELVLCTIARRKPRTRRSIQCCTIEIWDLQTFTIISQLDVDDNIKRVYFSFLSIGNNSNNKDITINSEIVYLFIVSDTRINVYLWDPKIILIATNDINQMDIVEVSVVDDIMMTCSNDHNSTYLWIHDFSELAYTLPKIDCEEKDKYLESYTISQYTPELKTPVKYFNPIVSTPKHPNIFLCADTQFKTSTVVRKNLKAPTIIDNSQERRKSVDGSIKMAMEKHLLRNTFILSPGSKVLQSSSHHDIKCSEKTLAKLIEDTTVYDDTVGNNGISFVPRKNSTMTVESTDEISSKTMILQKNCSSHLTLTTDPFPSSSVNKSSYNFTNMSFYRTFDYRHNNIVNHITQKIDHFDSLSQLIITNSNKNINTLQKLLDSAVNLNDLESIKILFSKILNIQEQWSIETCKIFLDSLSNKILKSFDPVEVVGIVKKVISKIIMDHGDVLKDKSSTLLYKKTDHKLECKQLLKKISCILVAVDDKHLQAREQMDTKEIRCLIKSVIGCNYIG